MAVIREYRSRRQQGASVPVALAVRRALRPGAEVLVIAALGAIGSLLAIPALSADAPDAEAADRVPLTEVVVTARRKALESAIEEKKGAEQIVDLVLADDAGKLPDNSITEVLQRIPGVSITHFAAINDPDHYSIEGSGAVVRGLSQVNSTLNGRDSFSANGGRALLWEDIPPELMAGVEVYKSPTPDQIEGGIGGTINLVTHMPFDFNRPEADLTAGYNYGDFVKKGNPAGSVLLTDTWQSGAGKFGILLDVAHSELQARSDSISITPYFPQLINGALDYIPGGFHWDQNHFDRKRTGLYEAMQWQPRDNLSFSQTFFRSDYSSDTWSLNAYTEGPEAFTVVPGGKNVFGANGGLLSSDDLQFTGWNPLAGSVAGASLATGFTGVINVFNRTTDYALSGRWQPTDSMTLSSGFQYVDSTSHTDVNNVFTQNSLPPFSLDLTTNVPTVRLGPGSALTDPAQNVWLATMDHYERHKGTERAWNADLNLVLSDEAFLRSLKMGVRVADLTEQDDITTYNWTGLTPVFFPTLNRLSDAAPGDTTLATFPNFFRGQAPLPSEIVLPSVALTNSFDIQGIHRKYGLPGDTQGQAPFLPGDAATGRTKSEAAYFMVFFGKEKVLGMPMNGNIGARLVHYENSANGLIVPPGGTLTLCNPNGTAPTPGCTPTTYSLGSGIYFPNDGGRNYTRVLPALNLQFLLHPDLHLRFAASQSLTNPSFTQMSAAGTSGFVTQNIAIPGSNPPVNVPTIIGGSATTGNPNLRPQISTNADVSLEWYPKPNFETHVSLFYKDIHDYLTYGTFNEQLPYVFPGGVTKTLTTAVQNYYNQQLAAIVKGAEFGFQRFFRVPAKATGWSRLSGELYVHRELRTGRPRVRHAG